MCSLAPMASRLGKAAALRVPTSVAPRSLRAAPLARWLWDGAVQHADDTERAAVVHRSSASGQGASGMSKFDFCGKRVLITGAGKGIGRDAAIMLAGCNAKVVALSRTEEDLVSLRDEIPGCETIRLDLSDPTSTRRALEEYTAKRQVDYLVNNAAIARNRPFFDVTDEDFDQCFKINVQSVLVVSQVVAKQMASHGAGAIVNVSSQSSFRALQDHTIYCSTKGALDQMTRVMALELGPHGIRVNSIHPTVVMTPMGRAAWSDPKKSGPLLARIPLGRFAETSDCAQAIAFLLSDDSSMIHGAMLPVEGGFLTN